MNDQTAVAEKTKTPSQVVEMALEKTTELTVKAAIYNVAMILRKNKAIEALKEVISGLEEGK